MLTRSVLAYAALRCGFRFTLDAAGAWCGAIFFYPKLSFFILHVGVDGFQHFRFVVIAGDEE